MFSIVQTAILNHLNPFQYLTHILTTLIPWVSKGKEIPEKVLESLMPWSAEIQGNTKFFSNPGDQEHRIKVNSDVDLPKSLEFVVA